MTNSVSKDYMIDMLAEISHCLSRIKTPQGIIAKPVTDGLNRTNEQLYTAFDQGVPIQTLVYQKSKVIDHVLHFCFDSFIYHTQECQCSLVAVGGYGRSELLPGSDIDLMVLLSQKPNKTLQNELSRFITFLWDI